MTTVVFCFENLVKLFAVRDVDRRPPHRFRRQRPQLLGPFVRHAPPRRFVTHQRIVDIENFLIKLCAHASYCLTSTMSKPLIIVAAFAFALVCALVFVAPPAPQLAAENGRHSSVTGYYGLDDDGVPMVDRHGIMVVLDGAIDPESVSMDTFEVRLDESTLAVIVETRVDGAYVFLRLRDELASDATPLLQIAQGKVVKDLAGNSTNRRKTGAVRINDGIAPRLTVTLSGGSGIGTGDEGPDLLTNDSIDIQVTSDEPLRGAPAVVVACDDLSWHEKRSGGRSRVRYRRFHRESKWAFPSATTRASRFDLYLRI